MSSLTQQREALMKRALAISAGLHGRSMTPAERREAKSLIDQIRAVDQDIEQARLGNDELLYQSFKNLTIPGPEGSTRPEGGIKTYRGSVASIAAKLTQHVQTKGLIDAIEVTVPTQESTPVSMGMPASSVWDVIPMIKKSREFSYLRQITRTNNAAPVAIGEKKPTSIYTLDRVNGRLKVIAHLSEPVDKYVLTDNASLSQFLQAEMAYGIYLALENQLFNGDGLGENFTGLNATSGIQTQAFATSRILTARKAITKTETISGDVAGAFVFSPTDWEAIETTTSTTGEYVLGDGVPVDRAARRLWGKPVSTSLAVPDGNAWYISEGSVELASDLSLDMAWGLSGDDFDRNQVRARLETRADLMVKRPMGVVKLALA